MNIGSAFRPVAASSLLVCLAAGASPASHPICAWPARGSLVLVGGGANRPAFMDRFMLLAGAAQARIVVIPTALDDKTLTPSRLQQITHLRGMNGITATVLHTRDRNVANSAAFVQPLRDATGVWILGGDELLLAQAYVGTRTQTEIAAVLSRGGVVGGTSAGALIYASVMVRAKASPLTILGTRPAFDLLPNSYVMPHWSQRKLNSALLAEEVAAYPSRMSIGIDEATAAIIQGSTLEVAGDGHVGIYDGTDHNGSPYALLSSGQTYDLSKCA